MPTDTDTPRSAATAVSDRADAARSRFRRASLVLAPIALLALLAAPGAEALVPEEDVTALPTFLPPIELSGDSRVTVSGHGDTVFLDGRVGHALEHFLARRAIAARHATASRLVDRTIVLPARDGARSRPSGGAGVAREAVPERSGGGRTIAPASP